MNNITHYQSIFVLDESLQKFVEDLPNYRSIYGMIRHDFADNPIMRALAYDLTIFYYTKELPLYNNDHSLMHLFRKFLVDFSAKEANFQRIRNHVRGNKMNAIFSAVYTVNVFSDYMREIINQLDYTSLQYWSSLQNEGSQTFSGYQSLGEMSETYLIVQKILIQLMKKAINDNYSDYEKRQRDLLHLINYYTDEEKACSNV